ncbi:MAG TPA: hypothetical protein PK299_15445 [Anaerolineales bacterium]|nr:hypothetical protein [Anaerolineales bacterium]
MFKQVCLFTFALFLSACAVDASQTAQNLPTPTVLVLPTETVNRIPIATEQSTVIPVSTPIGTETPARLYYELMRSPNSEYEAVRFEEDAQPMNIQTIQIQDKKGQPIQVITYQPSLGDPHPSLRLLTWSPDSTELFYFYEFHSDGYWTLTDGNDLRAINLQTGEIREIVNGWGIGLAVSPKGDNLAVVTQKK